MLQAASYAKLLDNFITYFNIIITYTDAWYLWKKYNLGYYIHFFLSDFMCEFYYLMLRVQDIFLSHIPFSGILCGQTHHLLEHHNLANISLSFTIWYIIHILLTPTCSIFNIELPHYPHLSSLPPQSTVISFIWA